MIGRKAFQQNFAPSFEGKSRDVVQYSREVRVKGDRAIISQAMQVSSDGVSIPVKQTVVWEASDGRWLMTHVHNSRAGEPFAVGELPADAKSIKVINERIATAAAIVGVAQ